MALERGWGALPTMIGSHLEANDNRWFGACQCFLPNRSNSKHWKRSAFHHGLNQSYSKEEETEIHPRIYRLYKHFETTIEYLGDISSIREHLGANLHLPNDAVVKTDLSTATKLCCSETSAAMSSLESGKLVQCPFPEVLSVESPGWDPENPQTNFAGIYAIMNHHDPLDSYEYHELFKGKRFV